MHYFDSPARHFSFLNEGFRQSEFRLNFLGYLNTGYHFLTRSGFTCGYMPTEQLGDDLGGYFLFNTVGKIIGPTEPFIIYYTLFISVLVFGLGLASLGIFWRFKFWKARLFAIGIFAFCALYMTYILDLHVFNYFSICLCAFFWGLIKIIPKERWLVLVILFGLLGGYLNLVRSHSGTVLLLLVSTCILAHQTGVRRILLIGSLAICIFPGVLQSRYLDLRNKELARRECTIPDGIKVGHYIWHTAYVGLSYIYNPRLDIVWSDEKAYAKTNALIPDQKDWIFRFHITKFHEENMKKLYLQAWKDEPFFVLNIYLAKIADVLIQCGVWLLGIVYFYRHKSWNFDRPLSPGFLVIGLFLLAPPLLAWPFPIYTCGIFVWSAFLCALLGANYLEKNQVSDVA